MNARKIGTTIRVTPDVVRVDVPLRHHDDLPELARRFERLAFQLRAHHQDSQLNDNGVLSAAYSTLREFNRKLKKEFPRD